LKKPHENPPPRLAIKRLDAPYRWLVQSESDPEMWYGVDLLENNRVGSCDCDHFRYRMSRIAAETTQPWNGVRCKHLVIVREALLNALLLSMANQQYDDEHQHDTETAAEAGQD
jgi:hypothetical protein